MKDAKPSSSNIARVCKKICAAIKGEPPIVAANALVAVLEHLAKLDSTDRKAA